MISQIPLMLDSTVYKQIPKLNSQLFKLLIKYTRIGIFKFYISEIVENEYLTWIQEESQEALNKVVSATESIKKYYDDPEIFGIKMNYNITATIAKSQIDGVIKNLIANWETFKNKTSMTVLPIDKNHGRLVMNAYFKGEPPFKKRKNRSDIPDAFIYYTLQDLLKDNTKVVFVSSDKEFAKCIKSEKIIVFSGLPELFACNEFKLTDSFFIESTYDERAKNIFHYFQDDIIYKAEHQIVLSNIFDEIEQNILDNRIGEYKDIYTYTNSISFDNSSLSVVDKTAFLVSFTAIISHSIKTEASKDDLSFINKERIDNLKENVVNDNGMFDIVEVYSTKVSGTISIAYVDSNPLLWEKIKDENKLFSDEELNEITITVENIEKNT